MGILKHLNFKAANKVIKQTQAEAKKSKGKSKVTNLSDRRAAKGGKK